MSTIVAAAGGGNWSSTGTWTGGVAPTSADDVQLGVTSGNVTIDIAAFCRSLDCTGYTGTLTHAAAITLAIGDGTAGAGNIALKLVAGMTYTLGSSTTSALSFVSTSATQQTITWGGKTPGNVTFNGAGGSWQVQDSWNSTNALVTLTTGALDTNNQTCTWSRFAGSTTGTRSLTLGSSTITLSVSGQCWLYQNAGATLSAASSTIISTGSGTFFTGNSHAGSGYGTISFQGAGLCGMSVALMVNLARLGAGNPSDSLMLQQSTTTITGTLTITGTSAANRILLQSATNGSPLPGTTRTVSAGAVSLTNVDMSDIAAAGAAVPFTGTVLGDCGGNTNVTFTPAATQTHTASAGGNWSDVTKWTSRVPLPQDDVIIDVNTTGTLTADMPRLGKSINFTGFAGTASFSSLGTAFYGSWTNGSAMTISGTQGLAPSGRSSYTMTSAGKTFTQTLTFLAINGTYTLQDALTTNDALFVNGGTLTTNNQTISCQNFSGLAVATVNMGSSTLNLTSTNAINIFVANGMTFNGGTSTIVISTVSSSTRTFIGSVTTIIPNLTYTVAGSTGTLVLGGSTTITTLNFSDSTNARTLTLNAGVTITVTNFNVNGTAGKLMTVNSSTPGTTTTLSKPSGYVACDYLSVRDSTAAGGASWYAGANSTNVSNNTGWFFQAYSSSKFLELM